MMPFMSIVIPVYNRDFQLKRALISLLSQTLPDWEAIVVDDFSDEKYKVREVVEGLLDQRIAYTRLPQRSERVIARRTGMMLAVGKMIGWLDSDDEYASHYVETVYGAVADYPNEKLFNFGAVVHHRRRSPDGVRYIGTSLRKTFHPAFCDGQHIEFKSGFIGTGSFTFKREVLGEIELLPEARNHVQLHKMAMDVHHLYPLDGPTLGNPYGDDWLAFYRLTRRYRSIPLDCCLYIQHTRV